MTKVNISIDTNLYFYRYAFAIAWGKKGYLKKESEKKALVHAAFDAILYDVSQYRGNVTSVMMAADSKGSWRHSIDRSIAYKGDRNKTPPFDLDEFHKTLEEFLDIMRQKGVYVFAVQNCEGDDIIYFLSRVLLENSRSSIILSSDSDLLQLVHTGSDGNFVYMFDGDKRKRRHFTDVAVSYREQDSPPPDAEFIFSLTKEDISGGAVPLERIVSQSHSVISPGNACMTKVLSGDDGDCVPSAVYYVKNNGGKLVSLTELMASRAVEALGGVSVDDVHRMLLDDKEREEYASKVIGFLKPKSELDPKALADGMHRNMLYTFLHKDVYPEQIRRMVLTEIRNQLTDVDAYRLHKKVVSGGVSRGLLDDTKYEMPQKMNVVDYNAK